MNKNTFMNKFKNKRVDVLGYGISNRPLVRMLNEAGADVIVRDKNTSVKSEESSISLIANGVRFIVGEGYLDDIDTEYIFRSPGIKPWENSIEKAIGNGAVLTSEMELFFDVSPAPIIGITGSDGKTTSTTLTYLMLEEEQRIKDGGKVYVGGNIGRPLLDCVDDMKETDYAVVELSSFQLYTMTKSPKRAAITNLTPNHLNWHKDMNDYVEAKCNICNHQGLELLVVNADNELTRDIGIESQSKVVFFSSRKQGYSEVVPQAKEGSIAIYESDGIIYADYGNRRNPMLRTEKIQIPGRHNIENYMTAIGLTLGLVSPESIANVADKFFGVNHRLSLVRIKDGVKYYNSSIDSSPTRTIAALSALKEDVVIICGGQDKHIPFDGLAKELCKRVKSVVLTGQAGPIILEALNSCPIYDPEKLPVWLIPDFDEAVIKASTLAVSGDAVLLSPACTSFDRFKNFEERGDYFSAIVNRI